ncbi:MAG: hypothetical protein R2702_07765 [Acidimicrobiales bacterium]
METCTVRAQRLERPGRDLGVGGGGQEVAAEGDEHVDLASVHRADRVHGVEARLARRREAELGGEGVEEGVRGLLVDAHRPVALHVGVAAHRAEPAAGSADAAAQQHGVGDLADGGHRLAVLGDAHRPADHDAVAAGQQLRDSLGRAGVDAGGGQQLVGVEAAQVGDELVGALAALRQEGVVEHVAAALVVELDEPPVPPLEQGEVGADLHLDELVGQLGAPPEHAGRPLGVLEPDEPGLGEGVDGDDRRASPLGLLESGEHAGVVGARVLADDHDELGLMDVVEGDAPLADPDGLGERHAARLVAHVRAVGEVVRPELAHEQLVQERRLVARAPGRVEDGAVGVAGGGEGVGHHAEGVVPRDRPVVPVALGAVHRLGEAALLAEPPVGAPGQVVHVVAGEEGGVDPAHRRLLGDRLHPVLAELERRRVVRVGPGAARAVEPVGLVELQEGLRRPGGAELTAGVTQAGEHPGEAGGRCLRRPDPQVALARIVDRRRGGAHRSRSTRCPAERTQP